MGGIERELARAIAPATVANRRDRRSRFVGAHYPNLHTQRRTSEVGTWIKVPNLLLTYDSKVTPANPAPPLPTRRLGKTGVEVTVLGIGCAWLGRRADGSIDEEGGLETILAAVDAGVRLIDTASMYVDGTAERRVGQALRARP